MIKTDLDSSHHTRERQPSLKSEGFLFQLLGVTNFLEKNSNVETGLKDLAYMSAQILESQKCSIMLLQTRIIDSHGNKKQEPYLRVFTHYGDLPKEAYEEITQLNDGIAGYVASTGECLLVEDINKSPFVQVARQKEHDYKSLISAPIFIGNQVIGVINVSEQNNHKPFNEKDLEILKIFALFIGKSIQIIELQNMLQSRFLEIAVSKEVEKRGNNITNITPDPAKVSHIVAKAIFKELSKGGFGSNQIINITGEILDLLREKIHREES
ncbi:GAF domain-containing protein [Cyanobacterium stanieri LEGE 03274]|uniref:GAF domain-containing protein n=1 Tax=Cyanobacterium stanieri LEGE 03274 TaxID=1828756 RepID=A0ABR9V2B1_9CHRO|nr:GAF domain-containing protein [Cyanobacterium stanieri]MBE9222028.1 GAF domain-containing protein [Cyanobacterium stanieri LEGE 03274]